VAASNREGPVHAVGYVLWTMETRKGVPPARPKSWSEAGGYWSVESAAERAALPAEKTIAGLKPEAFGESFGAAPQDLGRWNYPHGDSYSSKFSPLTAIDRTNLGRLKVAWEYQPGDRVVRGVARNSRGALIGSNVGHSPVFGDGKLYFATPGDRVVAVDARTGKEIWSVKPGGVKPARRGVTFWPGDGKIGPRIYFPAGWRLMALDARTGKPAREFNGGAARRLEGKAPPMIDGDRLIVATTRPGVEAFDIRTGKRLWKVDLLPTPAPIHEGGPLNDLNGGGVWSGVALDPKRHLIFLPTGNPGPPLHGAGRPGDNRPTSSIVAIDTRTGKTRWVFQEVAHDLWDFDVPAPPTLTTITIGGRPVDVLATVSKLGHVILLDRDGGRPIFDYRLRRAPTSTLRGERTAPYQPDLVTPQPFSKKVFTAEDITDISPASRAAVTRDLKFARFGFFEPPALGTRVVTFGVHGGGEWPGAAVDHARGRLYLTANQVPHALYLSFKSSKGEARVGGRGRDVYKAACASCHGDARQGYFQPEEDGGAYTPPLMGVSLYRSPEFLRSPAEFRLRHEGRKVPDADLAAVADWMTQADLELDRQGALSVGFMWNRLLDPEGFPASKPPWGLIAAMDLTTGRLAWSRPFGAYPELTARGMAPTGQPNFGGLMVTASNLIFATGTLDRQLRVLDTETGEELWAYDLPSAGSAPPMTYQIDGVQYVAVMATGGVLTPFDKRRDRDAVIVFRLG
jgi:quinoprotein glucose dehydrogenase